MLWEKSFWVVNLQLTYHNFWSRLFLQRQTFRIAPHFDGGFYEAVVDVEEDSHEGIERGVEEHGMGLELKGICFEIS